MDIEIIKKAGLSDTQAKAYIKLIEHSDVTAAELAEHIGESRTNTYAIIDRLLKFGLISKKEDVKYGAKFNANHPSCLEDLAERRRKVYVQNEKIIENNMNNLIDYFYKFSEEPGARVLQGIEGIKKVYEDTLKEAKDIYLVRTPADIPDLGEDYLNSYRHKRANLGITTFGLTPDTKSARSHLRSGQDSQMLMNRTFMPNDSYTAPVEIDVFGDKTVFITYGQTQMATTLQSPLIADAMRQILGLLSQQLTPASDDLKREILES